MFFKSNNTKKKSCNFIKNLITSFLSLLLGLKIKIKKIAINFLMNIRDQLLALRQAFFDFVTALFQKTAEKYGFPENPGMSLLPKVEYKWLVPTITDSLPFRKVPYPPQEFPRNYVEILLGRVPKPSVIPRVFYESKTDGYYSFYIENFKNIVFLPNDISEFLQVRCGFCLDLRFLQICHNTLFAMLVIYCYLISIRICLAWMITINPYTSPAIWLVVLVDWIEELSYGIIPVIGGVNISSPILTTFIGKVADSLNHFVFTMPFLPSEGVLAMAMVDGQAKHVLKFRYLPILWYKYPIPNDVRYYWYTERLDILVYMQKAYEKLDIQFLPDEALTDLSSLSPGILWKSIEDLSTLSDFIN